MYWWVLGLSTLKDRFVGLHAMQNFLGIVETHPTLNRSSKKAAEKLNCEIDSQMEKILIGR